MALPMDWPLVEKDQANSVLSVEQIYYPFILLLNIVYGNLNTSLFDGHTVIPSDGANPMFPMFTRYLIKLPVIFDNAFAKYVYEEPQATEFGGQGAITFFQVFPLFQDEFAFYSTLDETDEFVDALIRSGRFLFDPRSISLFAAKPQKSFFGRIWDNITGG